MSTVVHFVALYAVLVIQVFCAYGLIKYLKMKVSTEIHFKENSEERTGCKSRKVNKIDTFQGISTKQGANDSI